MVFDASAAIAFTRGVTAVGEILAEILDARDEGEKVYALVPAGSLLAGIFETTAVDLRRLINHPAVLVADTDVDAVRAALWLTGELNVPADTAAAIQVALINQAPILTMHGEALRASSITDIAELPIDINED